MLAPQIPMEWEQKVRAELDSMESIRWFGQPRPAGLMLASIPIVLFAIPWTAFAIFWICGAAGFKIPDFSKPSPAMLFPLFGVPFVLIGMGMLSTPFWMARAAKKTGYVITDKRVIIYTGGWNKTVRSIGKEHFQSITRRDRAGGRGDIIFNGLGEYSHKGVLQEVSLNDVENVKDVESILRSIAKPD